MFSTSVVSRIRAVDHPISEAGRLRLSRREGPLVEAEASMCDFILDLKLVIPCLPLKFVVPRDIRFYDSKTKTKNWIACEDEAAPAATWPLDEAAASKSSRGGSVLFLPMARISAKTSRCCGRERHEQP